MKRDTKFVQRKLKSELFPLERISQECPLTRAHPGQPEMPCHSEPKQQKGHWYSSACLPNPSSPNPGQCPHSGRSSSMSRWALISKEQGQRRPRLPGWCLISYGLTASPRPQAAGKKTQESHLHREEAVAPVLPLQMNPAGGEGPGLSLQMSLLPAKAGFLGGVVSQSLRMWPRLDCLPCSKEGSWSGGPVPEASLLSASMHFTCVSFSFILSVLSRRRVWRSTPVSSQTVG